MVTMAYYGFTKVAICIDGPTIINVSLFQASLDVLSAIFFENSS